MDQQIRIPVEIDTSKGLADFAKFSSSAKGELRKIAPGSTDGNIRVRLEVDPSRGIAGLNNFAQNAKRQLTVFESAWETSLKPIGQLEREIAALESAIKDATDVSEIKRFGDQVERLQTQLNNMKIVGLETNLGRIASSTRNANNSLLQLPRGANQANIALINLGRVAQDLPFGIIGIANNLNPLLESFQRARKEAGSFGGTLRALGSSLVGGGGIGLGLSLVTGAMSYFAMSNRSAKKDVEETKDTIDAAAEAHKNFAAAADKAAAATLGEAENIKGLRDLLVSTNTAYRDLTKSTINYGLARFIFDEKNTTVQKILSAEIQKQVLLRKQNNLLADVPEFTPALPTRAKRSVTQATRTGTINKDLLDLQELNSTITESKANIGILNALGEGFESLFAQFVDGKNKTKENTSEIIRLAKEIQEAFVIPVRIQFADLDTDALQLSKAKETIAAFKANTLKIKIPATELLNTEPTEIASPVISNIYNRAGEILGGHFVDGFKEEINLDPSLSTLNITEIENMFKTRGGRLELGLEVRVNPRIDQNNYQKALKDSLIQLNEDFANLIGNFQTQLYEAIGQGIGDAIASGDLQGLFKGIFGVLGNMLTELGKTLIATAIGLEAIKKAFKTLNPTVALGAGIALVALGSVIKARVANATPFAEGGLVSGPLLGLVGEGRRTSRNNPEVMAPLDRLQALFGNTVNNLLNGRAGGASISNVSIPSLDIPEYIELRADGDALAAVIAITNKKQLRGG